MNANVENKFISVMVIKSLLEYLQNLSYNCSNELKLIKTIGIEL